MGGIVTGGMPNLFIQACRSRIPGGDEFAVTPEKKFIVTSCTDSISAQERRVGAHFGDFVLLSA